MNNLKTIQILLLVSLFANVFIAFPQKSLYTISKEQKLFELSTVWKELSYNFANMDNCPGLNIDSLYRAYIPIVQNSSDDFVYYKSIQQFLAHFNNGHVRCEMPDYLWYQLSYPLLITNSVDGKLLIENIGSHYTTKVNIGDEILQIDNIPAWDYINKNGTSYVSSSNADEMRMRYSMFNPKLNTLISYAPKVYKRKIDLVVKTSHGIEKFQIPFDRDVQPLPNDSARQKKLTYLKKILKQVKEKNLFITDSLNSFTYLRFTECDSDFEKFFKDKYDSIKKYNNLIIDIADNGGGDGNSLSAAHCCLVNKDSIHSNKFTTRVNNSYFKAKASARLFYYKDSEVSNDDKKLYYPYYYDKAFENINPYIFANPTSLTDRYKGNIYIITSSFTGSAAEFFAIGLTENPKTVIVGTKTSGANGQPLVVRLKSGIEVFINTGKTYDFKGIDVSSGIVPDHECDFTDFYKAKNPFEVLTKFEGSIRGLKRKKNNLPVERIYDIH